MYSVQTYLERDGLPSNIIGDIAQDAENLLVVLTDAGIVRYDGNAWMPLKTDVSLPTSWGSFLEPLPNGDLVAYGLGESEFEMALIHGDSVVAIPVDSLLQSRARPPTNSQIIRMVSKSGEVHPTLIFTHPAWSHRYNFVERSWSHIPNPSDHVGTPFGVADVAGEMWFFSEQQVYRWTPSQVWEKIQVEGIPNQSIVRCVAVPGTREYIFLGRGWVAHWKAGQVVELWELEDDSFDYASDVTVTPDGSFYFTSRQYFYALDLKRKALRSFITNRPDAVSAHSRIYIDHEQNLWIGSYRGLFKINSFKFINYSQQDGLVGREGTATLEMPDGTLVLGHDEGYSLLREGSLVSAPATQNFPNTKGRILGYAKRPDQDSWYVAGGELGLGTLTPDGVIRWETSPWGVENVLGVAYCGDTLLVVNPKTLIYVLGGQIVKRIEAVEYCRQVKVLRDNRVVLLTSMGLFLIRGELVKPYYLHGRAAITNLYDLEETAGGIFIASDRGLLKWNEGGLSFAHEYGYEENRPIYDLLETRQGHLWLGTNDGVYQLRKGLPPVHYSSDDGLSGTEINRNSMLEDQKGNIWIGTNMGVSNYRPQKDSKDRLIPQTSIVAIRVGNLELPVDEDVTLDSDDNTLYFKFRGLSFHNEHRNAYRVQLHGFDTTWRYHSASYTEEVYTNLPAGRSYQLEVQARSGRGPWSPSVTSGYLYIRRPFFESAWFIGLILLATLAVGFVVRTLVNKERNRRWLEQEVLAKTQEIAQSEEELRAQNENLMKINQELDRFVYSASHDLSAPLKSISGLLHIAKLDADAGKEQQAEYLNRMEKSVQQLNKFIRELIDFSRNSRIESDLVPIPMSELVNELLENLQFMDHFDRMKFRFAWDPLAEIVIADEFRLRVILNNLLSNAVKFQRMDEEEPWVKVETKMAPQGFQIIVSDNGLGIDPEFQGQIFDMFFRANEVAMGSGLGLYIAKEAANRMGGVLSVESTLNAGTSFHLFIPKS